MKFKSVAFLSIGLLALTTGAALSAADATSRVVKIRTGVENAMKFDVPTLTAAPGETLKIVLTNATTLPKAVMGHNWVLLKAGADPVAYATVAASDQAGGYMPEKLKDQVLAFIPVLGPNETAEVTLQVPAQPGEYPFLCSFPGHCVVGMKGVLVVKK
ncbi:MAG: azurin [Verrucomicrobia bacterium]|nr:azurin [Verrucomicrobiota bacterium]